jgi:peptidoglycan/LPS O-acetylase OafA/YrhL
MRSSTGQHYVGLDHVRALAAFMVVTWHFSHKFTGVPVPFNQAPLLGFLDEGHAGVALFMTLSGYLFAKLIDGRPIRFGAFLWNRALRLLPLLVIVMFLVGLRDYRSNPGEFADILARGLVFPSLPNGGWSLTAEMHFYLLLPMLLWAAARWDKAPLALVAGALSVRVGLFALGHNVQDAAYWTIVGRLDQFALGIFFFYHRAPISGRIAGLALVAAFAFYAWFDAAGGFYNMAVDWPWLLIPTFEGAAFGTMIAWYDGHPFRPNSLVMRFVQKAGEYSYSIYLLHFFAVFGIATLVDLYVVPLTSLYVALPFAALFFVAMVGIGHLSYVFIEAPPLKYRRKYLRLPGEADDQAAAISSITAASVATIVPPPSSRLPS